MAFDGLVMYGICRELQNANIVGGKIDKIFKPNNNEIVLGIYNGSKCVLDIVISPNNYRICLTNSPKPNPNIAPNFCMVLRKYLLGTRITKIYTMGLERILIIECEGYNKTKDFSTKKLIIELMGKHSNIILANSDNVIIDSLRHFDINSNSYRNILPNYKYIFPISNKLDIMKFNTFEEFLDCIISHYENKDIENVSISDIISNTFIGISKNTIISILNKLKIDDIYCEFSLEKVYHYIFQFLNNIEHCNLFMNNNNDYSIFIDENKNNLEMNYFIDSYYSQKEKNETFILHRDNLYKLILGHLKKLNNKLTNVISKINECKNTDMYRLYGELIVNNLYRIKDSHLDSITLENYYDNNNLITIPLDKSITPSMNAEKYFKKYNKLKNAKKIVESQKSDIENIIFYMESIIYEIQISNDISDIDMIYNEFYENFENTNIKKSNSKSHKKQYKKSNNSKSVSTANPIKYNIDGLSVIVGRNNKENDLITKQANSNDLWFHTKDIHGSHVILKIDKTEPKQETINKCASIAAFYSKAKDSSNVAVDYTYIKFVKKPTKSKPGMVIYSNNKTVIVNPKIEGGVLK